MRTFLYVFVFLIFMNWVYAQRSDFKSVDFTRADNIATLHQGASLDNLPLLAHKLTNTLPTEVEKFRAIYRWICQNIKGDKAQFSTVDRNRKKLQNDSILLMKWNREYKKVVFKKLLKHKKTMCTGYAYLLKELCYLANITCVIIDGYGRSVEANTKELEMANHSWNAVQLHDKWYLCDATWSSGYMIAHNIFMNAYNDGYFLADPVLFAKNHLPLEQKWLLTGKTTATAFVNSPLIYGETFENYITPILPEQMDISIRKNDELEFSFKTDTSIAEKNIALIYYRGIQEKRLKIYDIKNVSNTISFKHKFKHKGVFDIHLKIHGAVVATYTMKVAKS